MHRVCSHDAARNIFNRSLSKGFRNRRQASTYILHWILTANNASRRNQHLFRVATDRLGDARNNFAGIVQPFVTCCNVRILRNYDHSSRLVVCNILTTQHNARPGKAALCEHARSGANFVGNNERKVVARVFNANIGDVSPEPLWKLH